MFIGGRSDHRLVHEMPVYSTIESVRMILSFLHYSVLRVTAALPGKLSHFSPGQEDSIPPQEGQISSLRES